MRRAILPVLFAGCATLADAGGGDRDLPNAQAGPFRALAAGEVGGGRIAPQVLRDKTTAARDAAVFDDDGDPTTFAVTALAVGTVMMGNDVVPALVRYQADDGRTFEREGTPVLFAADGWEGRVLASPSAFRVGGDVVVHYETASGIGVAASRDGGPFMRVASAPVLGIATSGWDAGVVPRSPSVIRSPAGFRMFYGANGHLGEARSDDGVVWTRASSAVLETEDDEVALEAPMAVTSRSPLGRELTWVYYVAVFSDGRRVVAVAAREGEDGPLVRGTSPVFGTEEPLALFEPNVIRFERFSLLYVTTDGDVPALLGGVAPATAALPPSSP